MIKKVLPLLIVGILVISGLGAAAIQKSEENNTFLTEKIEISTPIVKDTGEFVTVNMENANLLMSTGKPMVPYVTKTFEFPMGTRIENTNVQIGWERVDLTKKIEPAQAPVALTDEVVTSGHEINTFDQSVYQSTELYPSEPYVIRYGSGISDGDQVIYVNVKCYGQYSPANNYINVPNDVTIEVEYEEPEVPLFTADVYDLLIITPAIFEDALQRLVTHKNSIGTKTKMITTEEIYANYDGVADWEEIKMYLADVVIDLDIEYVLLVGGHIGQTHDWYIPEFLSNNFDDAYSGSVPYDLTYGCDLYYADVYYVDQFGYKHMDDWDTDNDGIYAEGPYYPGRDNPDFYPDVYLGRLPIRYSWEVDIAIDKIIDYELHANPSWFEKGVVCGGDTSPRGRYGDIADLGIYEGELTNEITAGYLESIGWDVTRCWTSDQGDIQVTGPEDIWPVVNQGCGWINMQMHANPALGGNHIMDSDDFAYFYTIFDVRYYTNDGKLPFMVCDGCHNSQFNVTMQQIVDAGGFVFPRAYFLEYIPTDASSWFLLQGGGGCIGIIGNTALGYGYLNSGYNQGLGGWIMPRFAHAFAMQGKETTGDVWATGIKDYLDNFPCDTDDVDRKTMEERPLLGDPSIKLGGAGVMSGDEDTTDTTDENPVIDVLTTAEVPTWQKGDKWVYRLEDFNFEFAEIEDRKFDIELKMGDVTMEIADVSANKYIASLASDDLDVTFDIVFNAHTGGDTLVIPKMTFENIALNGQMTINKANLGIEKIDITLTIDLVENLENLGIQLPSFAEFLLPFMEIPANIDLGIEFDQPYQILEFPLDDGGFWGLNGGVMTVTIDGSAQSFWLKLLNFVNKFIEIVPPEFAKYLPDIDISEVLEDFGFPTEMEFEIPETENLMRKPMFEVINQEQVSTPAGSFNAYKVYFVQGTGVLYYSPEQNNVVKIEGPFSDFIPILQDLKIELVG